MCRKCLNVVLFSVVMVVIMGVHPASAFSRRPPEPAFEPGKVLVKFHDGVTSERSTRIVELEGGTINKVLASTGVFIVVFPEGVEVSDAINRISSYFPLSAL